MTSSDTPPSAIPAWPEVREASAPADAEIPEVTEPEVDVEADVATAAEPQHTEPSEATSAVTDPVTARIAEQLTALDTLAELPLAEHAQAYQHLHAELQDALADIDGP